MEATTGWTDGKTWEKIAWGELRWEGARWKRWETVGNSLGRAPLGGSETEEVWTSWTDGKPWEIALGELRWEEATY